jgi:hypothetical protein
MEMIDMKRLNNLSKYNKALVLLVLIVVVAVVEKVLGFDLGLNAEHYLGLIVADFLVWLVPNEEGS